jgi:hypothetical protein
MEEVRHDADLGTDLCRDRRALFDAVDDVSLIAVERFEKQETPAALAAGANSRS